MHAVAPAYAIAKADDLNWSEASANIYSDGMLSVKAIKAPLFRFGSDKNQQQRTQQNSELKVTSSRQAANLAKRKFKAKVLSVSTSQSRSGAIYRVKMLSSDGVIFYALVYAKTGSVVRG